MKKSLEDKESGDNAGSIIGQVSPVVETEVMQTVKNVPAENTQPEETIKAELADDIESVESILAEYGEIEGNTFAEDVECSNEESVN